ncbi:Crp/Fnr family transcriptional regulator [Methylobacterium terricola]|nr:Crp/Fnr family transcriptional regulator [Methylobacterium terricola]
MMTDPAATGIAHVPRLAAPGWDGADCALARRLGGFAPLDAQDRAALAGLIGYVRPVGRHTVLVEQDSVADHAVIVFAGFASRGKHRASGRRQIVAYLVPGDLCDRGVLHDHPLGHAIETLTPCLVARVPRAAYLDLLGRHPRIALALQRARLAEEATVHEWVANIGMRSGTERMAHLLCELMERLGTVGQVTDGQYALPLTQTDLADTLGLSSVHVNRVLQALRRDRLISLCGHRLRVLAPRRLRELAEFGAGSP